MPTETLQYETARHAQQLFNSDPKNLKLLEDQLAVKATSREGWIKLEGEQDAMCSHENREGRGNAASTVALPLPTIEEPRDELSPSE